MKKITLLAVAFVAISFASCKKDRTCTCTTTVSGGGASTTFDPTIITHKKVKKSAAVAVCHDTESTDDGVTTSKKCTLS